MFETRIFYKIRRCWIEDQNRIDHSGHETPVPELRDFIALIETAFVASLKREEEQRTRVSIILLSEKDKEHELSNSNQSILVFDRRYLFSPESVAKLSPACDPRIGALVVSPGRESAETYEIWGLMYFDPTTNRFNEIPVHHEVSTSRPDPLMVTVDSPGSLMISRGNYQIGHFIFGDFFPATPTPFLSQAMGGFIISSIQNNPAHQAHGGSYWHMYRDALRYLLRDAKARGHGGTIIVIPESKLPACRSGFDARYLLRGQLQIEKLMEQVLTLPMSQQVHYLAYNRAVTDRLSFLAQLACVDGALLLSDHLEPIAFGATLKAGKWQGKVVVGPDRFGHGDENFDLSTYGTRHNSAANFIGAFPYCYGFVVSQDGPIRGFVRKDEGTLYCWPDCAMSKHVVE